MIALFAVFAFALLLVAAFVIDVGNWQEHRRHLQVQVDNGAKSAGTFFTNCFLDPAGSNANIRREARRFGGDPLFQSTFGTSYGPPYNLQVDDPERVVLNLNRSQWPPATGGLVGDDFEDGYDLDPTVDGVQNDPCSSKTLLVRAKDRQVPTFFGGVVPGPAQLVDVRAKARVEIDEVIVMKGFLPWAVPEVRPRTVVAMLVNESQTDPVPTLDAMNPTDDPPTSDFLNGEPVDLWETVDLNLGGGPDYGVVVALSTHAYQDTDFLGKTLSTICAMPAVVCYKGGTPTSGVDFITGLPKTMGSDGAGGTVALRDLELVKLSGCDDSSPYFQWVVGCQFRLRADIDPARFPTSSLQVKLRSSAGTCSAGQGCDLTLNNGWFESPALTIPDGRGRVQYDIEWKSGNGNCNNPPPYCGGTTKIAVPFAATDEPADPGYVAGLRYVALTEAGVIKNSFQSGSSHTVRIQVGLTPPLRVTTSEFDPPIMLRFASRSGSLNQALDCDHPNLNLDDEVRDGCQTFYGRNLRDLQCSGGGGPTWTGSNLPPPTFIPPSGNLLDAPDCVAAKTGDVTSMAKGLHERFETPCVDNNWIEFRNAILNDQPLPNDPRYVTLIVTNFGAFSGSGATVVPVEVHAGFYVTGWFHQQSAVGCPENDPPPPPACAWPAPPFGFPVVPPNPSDPDCDPAHNNNKGNVWGYFVTTVLPVPGGIVSHERCEFGELGTCAARLVE
jgi:hypothetical protein